MKTNSRTRNTLTHDQYFDLRCWMASAVLAGIHTHQALADKASGELGFPISASSAETALKAAKRELPSRPAARIDRNHVVAKTLAALLLKLNEPVPPELLAIVDREAAPASA